MYSKGHVSTIRRQITLEKNGSSRTFGTENGSVFRDTRSRIWFMATLNKSWSPEKRNRREPSRCEYIASLRSKRRWETSPISYSMPSYKYYITSLSTVILDTILYPPIQFLCLSNDSKGTIESAALAKCIGLWVIVPTLPRRPSQRSFILLEDALRVDSAF